MSVLKSFVALLIIAAATSASEWHTAADGKNYYIQSDLSYNWFEAFDECSKKDLQLVEIDSEEKNKALLDLLKTIFPNSHTLWLGANDEFSNTKQFVWAASGQPISYSHWAPNQPDGKGHCVHTHDSHEFKWNSVQCDTKMGYMCEEHNLQTEFRRRLEVKRLHVGKVTHEAFSDYLHRQKTEIDKLAHNIDEIDKKQIEIAATLTESHKKIQEDIKVSMSEHQSGQAKVIDETTKTIQDKDTEMKSSIEVTHEKFSKIFDDAQKSIEELLVWDRELN